jgi:hypothetical protein
MDIHGGGHDVICRTIRDVEKHQYIGLDTTTFVEMNNATRSK